MENFKPTKEQIKVELDQLNSINTEEQVNIIRQTNKLASEIVENNNFDIKTFNENYADGVSANNMSFGYQFTYACVDKLLHTTENEIKQKLPLVLQSFSHLNDSAFAFGLELLKEKLSNYHPQYKEPNMFANLIKDCIGETNINMSVVQNVIGETKDKATKSISIIRENSFSLAESNNKLQHK